MYLHDFKTVQAQRTGTDTVHSRTSLRKGVKEVGEWRETKLKSMTSSMNILKFLWAKAKKTTSVQHYWSLLFWLPSLGKHHLILAMSHKKQYFLPLTFIFVLFWLIVFWFISYGVALIQEPTWTLRSLWPWWSWESSLWRSSLCMWWLNSWGLLPDPVLSMGCITVGLITYNIITSRKKVSHKEEVIWITFEKKPMWKSKS